MLTAMLGGGFWPVQRLAVGFVLAVVWAVAAWRWGGAIDRLEGGLIALLAWGVLSAIWVGAAPLASKEALAAWLVAFTLWAVARRGSGPARRLALRLMAAGATALALTVVVSAVTTGSIRVGGLFENPNYAAALLLPTLPLGWMALGPVGDRARVAWVGLMVTGIVLTGSRAGLLGLVVIAAVLLPRGRLRTAGTLAVAGIAASAVVWRFVSQPDLLAWHRVSIWWTVIKIWATRPLTGVGPGSLVEAAGVERILHPDEIGRYQFVVGVAESSPLGVLVQLGVVGMLIAVVVTVLWLTALRQRGTLRQSPVQAAVLSVACFALFHDLLTADPVLWWWAVLAGCAERPFRTADGHRSGSSPRAARWILGMAMLWLTAWGVVAPAWARVVFRAGPPAASRVERALRLEPWFDDAPAARARMLTETPEPWSWRTAAEALHWAERARRAHPGLARRWADLGLVHLRVLTDLGGTDHDAEAARDALTRACELDPHLPWHWLERARLERVLGDSDQAVRFVHRALAEEPNTVRGWLMLARLELERGRVGAARQALNEATTRAGLIERSGLADYERELLMAPGDQVTGLGRALAGR